MNIAIVGAGSIGVATAHALAQAGHEVTVYERHGTAAEEVPGQYADSELEIGFNARYLLDILGQLEGDTIELHLADASAPTLIRETDKSPALYVLMPMRV